MKIKKFIILLFTIAIAVSLGGCVGTNVDEIEPKPYPVTVQNISIESRPNAVASLSPSIAKMLIELGYGDNLVGYSNDYPDESIPAQKRIGTIIEPNLAAIGEVKPEFVFTTQAMNKDSLDKLSKVGVRVIVMPTCKNIAEVKQRYVDLITIMGGLFDADTVGKPFIADLEAKLAATTVPDKKTFLYIATLDPVIVTPDTLQGDIAAIVGDNVAASFTNYTVTAEDITTLSPDIILYDSNSVDPTALAESEIFAELAAIKDGKIYAVSGTDMSLSTATLLEAATKLVAAVTPAA